MSKPRSEWLRGPAFDCAFILGPALLAVVIVYFLPLPALHRTRLSPLWWLILVQGIDMPHVYSTFYRTYFNAGALRAHRRVLLWAPVCCAIAAVWLFNWDRHYFWMGVTYLAIYHFVRQQYGFMFLYLGRQGEAKALRWAWLDRISIYSATFYPLIYWHTHLPRRFDWFVSGVLVELPYPWLDSLAWWVYVAVIAAYLVKESMLTLSLRHFNWPKNLLLLGTMASWYVGMVEMNAELPFALTNIVAHGIPYIALVWAVGHGEFKQEPGGKIGSVLPHAWVYSLVGVPLFIFMIEFPAFLEHGLTTGFITHQEARLFPLFLHLPQITNATALSLITPLMVLPQLMHYVLDGFIWKLRDPKTDWQDRAAKP